MKKSRKIVYKVEEGEDPRSIYCTTYQMRNFYRQFADGFFSSLDVMNYIQHHKVVTMMKKGDRVLDVCCGRGLLLPMIRYYRKDIREYVGVDISKKNISEQNRRSGIREIEHPDLYYPFKLTHVICSCEDMAKKVEGQFDLIVYTSSIEHMQKKVGFRSLENCFKLLKPSGRLFLSCPNTIRKRDPYDTQYAAHLYEWDLNELTSALQEVGFKIHDCFGLVGKVKDFNAYAEARFSEQELFLYRRFKEYLPTEWLMAFFPILYPDGAAEVAILCGKKGKMRRKAGMGLI